MKTRKSTRKPSARSTSPDYITATDIYKYLTCPHWPWYDRFATKAELALKRELTEGEVKRLDDGIDHEREVMRMLMRDRNITELATTGKPGALFEATKRAMESGAECIYQGTLLEGTLLGRPDVLMRVEGASRLGNWHYVPVDVKSSHDVTPAQRYELAFYAKVLSEVQGVFPEKAAIVNRDVEWHWVDPSESLVDLGEILEALDAIRNGEKPEPAVRKSCFDTGPWGEACLADAKQTNDIALLYNVDMRKLAGLRGLGIRTVDDAAEMDVDEYAGAAEGLTRHALDVIRAQARSLRDGTVFIRKSASIPETPLEVHFDIETDLPNDADYLYGFFLRQPGKKDKTVKFIAERPEDEGEMWKEFLAWLETLPSEYIVIHYAAFEPSRLRLLEKRHGGSEALHEFLRHFIDVKTYATKHVTFPLYFYGLKRICNFLGFSWRSETKSGGESIDRYQKWCASGDRRILDDIIVYNEDDERATAFLTDWLRTYAREAGEYNVPYPWKKSRVSSHESRGKKKKRATRSRKA